jgi:phosphinothricin acetyltransferase
MPTIRLAQEADAEPIRGIYAPFCEADSHVSFEVEPPTIAEMARRITRTLERFPWLVCDEGGVVLGYVYAGAHSERAAYQWSVNVSAYVAEGQRGRGIGRALYTSLFAILTLQGYVNAYAGATVPNPASLALHKALGFEEVGIYRGVGYKCGTWQDTSWLQRPLVARRPEPPSPPLSLAEAKALPGWSEALEAGLQHFRPTGDAP